MRAAACGSVCGGGRNCLCIWPPPQSYRAPCAIGDGKGKSSGTRMQMLTAVNHGNILTGVWNVSRARGGCHTWSWRWGQQVSLYVAEGNLNGTAFTGGGVIWKRLTEYNWFRNPAFKDFSARDSHKCAKWYKNKAIPCSIIGQGKRSEIPLVFLPRGRAK